MSLARNGVRQGSVRSGIAKTGTPCVELLADVLHFQIVHRRCYLSRKLPRRVKLHGEPIVAVRIGRKRLADSLVGLRVAASFCACRAARRAAWAASPNS
jgi:hypothetical protein